MPGPGRTPPGRRRPAAGSSRRPAGAGRCPAAATGRTSRRSGATTPIRRFRPSYPFLSAWLSAAWLLRRPGGPADRRPVGWLAVNADQIMSWAAAYERAWRAAGTETLAALFTPDAIYRQSPYSDPVTGLPAIARRWE